MYEYGDAFVDKRTRSRCIFRRVTAEGKVRFETLTGDMKELTRDYFYKHVDGGPSYSNRDLENAYRQNFEWNVEHRLGPNGREYLEDMIREAVNSLSIEVRY